MVTAEATAKGRDAETALRVQQVLERVMDPEIPVLSVVDLGIVRDIMVEDSRVEIVITPTYTGCPATQVIERDIAAALAAGGFPDARLTTRISPPWTTHWISKEGRRKLRTFGIAPPIEPGGRRKLFGEDPAVPCPRCGSTSTVKLSEFGSTACKALYRCNACLEPFDYFKCF
jgi:ring-1,2-phenylacetyl-CoA epoxidase subunit PaaD